MAIGQKMGSLKTLKKSLAKGAASGSAWIKYIPKNGSMNVRFIQEPEEWVNYLEHWDSTIRKSYPCTNEDSCPGCTTGERKSARYLANAVDVDTDRVIPLQMPKDLANRLVVRYERNGTLTDRDFELSRSGEGLDTVYDLDAGPADRKKITKYQPLDLLKVLDDAVADVFGAKDVDDDDDDEPEAKPSRQVKVRGKSKAVKALDEADVEVDDDDEDEAPKAKPAAKRAAAKKATKKAAAKKPAEPVFTPDEDDDEDAEDEAEPEVDDIPDDSDDTDADDDGEEYDEETLKALPLGALRAVARDFGVVVKGKNADQIIAEILESGEPVDDDGMGEPPY